MYNEYQFIAVDKIERVIIVIAAGPINQDMMEELERVSECKICHYVSTWRDIYGAIQRNSKELGGEAQVELTGLGSMLLEAPNFASKASTSITQKVKKLGEGASLNGIANDGARRCPERCPDRDQNGGRRESVGDALAFGRLGAAVRHYANYGHDSAFAAADGILESASSGEFVRRHAGRHAAVVGGLARGSNGRGFVGEFVGDQPRACRAVCFRLSTPSASPLSRPRSWGSSAGLPTVNKDNDKDKDKDATEKKQDAQSPRRMSSFLQIRK